MQAPRTKHNDNKILSKTNNLAMYTYLAYMTAGVRWILFSGALSMPPASQMLLVPLMSLVILPGCGYLKRKKSEDHVRPPVNVTEAFVRPTDCRAHIKEAVCVVDSASAQKSERPCVADNSTYVAEFEKVHDEVPPYLQKMFCSVRHFYIEADLKSLAYAAPVWTLGKLDGTNFGIRQSIFENKLAIEDVISWKEQTNFTDAPEYAVSQDLPRVGLRLETLANPILHYILVHEFGHFFDFANGVSEKSCMYKNASDEDCTYTDDVSWGSLSWETPDSMKKSLALVEDDTFCFYFCEKADRSRSDFDTLYKNFDQMPFATTYATSNSVEDFAETFTFFVNSTRSGWDKRYLLPDGQEILLVERFNSELLARKRNFVKALTDDPNLRYP
jgi:hypothetical protein